MKFENPPSWQHVVANALHVLHERSKNSAFYDREFWTSRWWWIWKRHVEDKRYIPKKER